MSVSSLLTTPISAPSDTSNNSSANSKEYNQFLSILLTELQNQSPLDPMDTKDFTNQIAQYSTLEQQINTNSKLDSLLSAVSSSSTSPVSLLGNTVDFNSNTSVVQGGNAIWTYNVKGADTVHITVKDSTGKTVYDGEGDTGDGTHTFKLNAATDASADGAPLTITVTAKDADGKVITPTVMARAKVDAVDSSSGTVMLEASGYSFAASLVTRVATPTSASNA